MINIDELLDIVWFKIVALVYLSVEVLEKILSPINLLGPALAILILVQITVAVTKGLNRIYTTKRHLELKKQFTYWYNLRSEALTCDDPEKGKLLAKNIDQAHLNKVYYDYFFEGLLKNILTTYLPVLIMMAYVNEIYKPERLKALFGRPYIFQIKNLDGEIMTIGAVFWYVITLLVTYLGWFVIRKIRNRKKSETQDGDKAPVSDSPA